MELNREARSDIEDIKLALDQIEHISSGMPLYWDLDDDGDTLKECHAYYDLMWNDGWHKEPTLSDKPVPMSEVNDLRFIRETIQSKLEQLFDKL